MTKYERSPKSPFMESIEKHECKITFVGKPGGQTKTMTVNGDEWPGSEYIYKITVPQKGKEDWITELKVWSPLSLVRKFWKPLPETEVFIQTGKGEMMLTNDSENKQMVLEEINRQLKEARERDL